MHPVEQSYFVLDSTNSYSNYDMVVVGNYCIASLNPGFDVIDVSNPSAPARVYQYRDSTHTYRYFSTDGTILYMHQNGGIKKFDVTNPQQPVYLGLCPMTSIENYFLTATRGDLLFVAETQYPMLYAIDTHNPSHPVIVDSIAFGAQSTIRGEGKIDLARNLLFVPVGEDGFRVVDISDPSHLVVRCNQETYDNTTGLELYQGHVLVANNTTLELYDYSSLSSVGEEHPTIPCSFELEPAFPNPFNSSTTIRYSIPAAASVRLAVYDVSGREVTTMTQGNQAAGKYTYRLNGSQLASGIYFVKLTAGSATKTQKIVLVR